MLKNNTKNILLKIRYKILTSIKPNLYPLFLSYFYLRNLKKILNLKKPKKLTEKIQWLKIHDCKKEKTFFTNKLLAKEFVEKNFKEIKCAKLYQQGNNFNDIILENLPESFVLKTNHACHTNFAILNKNKLSQKEKKQLEKKYNEVLSINYTYWSELELHYSKIKPQIYAEEFLYDNEWNTRYQLWYFNGKCKFIEIFDVINGEGTHSCYDRDWNILPFCILKPSPIKDKRPKHLDIMIDCADKLAKDFILVRVDFYKFKDEIYFAELTFHPQSGFSKFYPSKYDEILGKELILPID